MGDLVAGPIVQIGNAELDLVDVLCLTQLAGPIGKQDEEQDALYFAFEKETYTREEVLAIVQLIFGMCPNECGLSERGLRLWWD